MNLAMQTKAAEFVTMNIEEEILLNGIIGLLALYANGGMIDLFGGVADIDIIILFFFLFIYLFYKISHTTRN